MTNTCLIYNNNHTMELVVNRRVTAPVLDTRPYRRGGHENAKGRPLVPLEAQGRPVVGPLRRSARQVADNGRPGNPNHADCDRIIQTQFHYRPLSALMQGADDDLPEMPARNR